jgi:hypothetical protein
MDSATTQEPSKASAGLNFLLTDNSDPVNYLNNQYNTYHVPTDFEYVGLHTELGHNFNLDVKPYTYNYDNSEKFSNVTPITYATTINGSKTYNGLAIQPCNVQVKGKLPCGVDKYKSHRKYGETSTLSQVSKFGIRRAGLWYEWAATNRHQFPSDPSIIGPIKRCPTSTRSSGPTPTSLPFSTTHSERRPLRSDEASLSLQQYLRPAQHHRRFDHQHGSYPVHRGQRHQLHRSLHYHQSHTHRWWRQHQRSSRTQRYAFGNVWIVPEALELC